MRNLWVDTRAVAAVEFAIVAPFMLLLYVGGVELGDGLAISVKVSETAHTVADLVTRNACVNNSSLSTMLGASTATIAPYSAANATVQIAQLKITDTSGTTTLDWGKVLTNGTMTDMPATPAPTLPQAVINTVVANAKPSAGAPLYLIFSAVQYNYTPNLGYTISGTVPIADSYYLFPRVSSSVQYPC
jgi:Flp pilus assembly protein TadG